MRAFLHKLRYVRLRDVLSVFALIAALPWAFRLKRRRPHIWLLCERRSEARDNGFWFYRYLRLHQPQVDTVYAIDPRSPDAAKVAALGGEVIPWGGVRHWAYYLAAEYNVSSQKDGKPNAALCHLIEVYGHYRNRRVFLQHGVIHNDTKFLHYENSRIGFFVCGAKPEYDFVRETFGYPQGAVHYLGLARFDGLHDHHEEPFVLVMPTWRKSIARPARFARHLDREAQFKRTSYYRHWHGLLTDQALHDELADAGLKLAFYPHANMQRFLDEFKDGCDDVIFCDWRKNDVQDLLKRATFLITDYSSVAMDFAYMGKPLLYYQFDQEDFRRYQYAAGYFDYARDGFGPVCETLGDVREALRRWEERGRTNEDVYLERGRAFFTIHDDHNCKRIYQAICDWGRS